MHFTALALALTIASLASATPLVEFAKHGNNCTTGRSEQIGYCNYEVRCGYALPTAGAELDKSSTQANFTACLDECNTINEQPSGACAGVNYDLKTKLCQPFYVLGNGESTANKNYNTAATNGCGA